MPVRLPAAPARLATALAVLALANALLLAPLPLEARLVGALLLFVLLPGALFVAAIFEAREIPEHLERCLLAIGAGYVLAVLLGLALYALIRPFTTAHVLVSANLLNGALLVAAIVRSGRVSERQGSPTEVGARRGGHVPPAEAGGMAGDPGHVPPAEAGGMANTTLTLSRSHAPLLVLALAAPLRLWNLGHSELQGDESEVVWRAFALVQGRPDAMVAHHKPPGELLMTAVFSAGLGGITELVGRLPFALAGVVACLAFYQLGRALFGARAGLAAGLLLAVNGYFVAFGRMLQYESVALLLDSLAVLCLYRFARGDGSRPAYAAAGGLLLAGSGLMALSGAFLLPVAALALGPCLAGPKRASRRVLAVWLWPLALIAPCFGLVALGFARAPDQAGASSPADALREFIGFRFGGGQPYFNAERFLLSADHYLSSLYLLVVLGIGALALVEPLYDRLRAFGEPECSEQAPRRVALAALAPEARNLAFASLFVGGLALLLGTARRSLGWKLALVWMAAPAFAHLFLVRLPYTHWRELFPGLLLLVAHAVGDGAMGRAGERARKATFPASPLRPIARSSARPLALVGALFLAATAHYVYTAWVRPWPEYQLTYPRDRHPLDWLGDDGAGAAGGTFGAARQHGWKVVGELATAGELPDKYATNARPSRPLWYLKRQPVCLEQAELYVLDGITARDRQAIEAGAGPPGFTLAGRVLVEDRPTIALFLRRPPPGPPREYRAEAYGRDFDRTMASPWVPVGDHYRPFDDVPPQC